MRRPKTTRLFKIRPASAMAFTITKNNNLKVVDVLGKQVSDFVAFNKLNADEKFSASRTRSENGKIRISSGDKLFSNLSNVMFEITKDTCGVHDLLYPPCNRWVFENRYKVKPHDGCQENLAKALSMWGIRGTDVPDPFNIFEHSIVDTDGRMRILEPVSIRGSYVQLKARMDCIVGMTACAVDVATTNAGKCKPIHVYMQPPSQLAFSDE